MPLDVETTAWLETENGDRISVRGICTFGRVRDSSVVLPTGKMSRRHAMIHEQGGEFWVVDLGSTNGLKINGVRLTHPTPLRTGDQIQLPAATFTFRQSAVAQASRAQQERETQVTQNQVTEPELRTEACWLLLADLRGFSRMSQEMPPEKLAPLIGKWVAECQKILLKQKGLLAQFLGDGFLAYWAGGEESTALIASACRDFQALQKPPSPAFRIVVHYGVISFRGRAPDGSTAMLGPELNFTYRLEKVASRLKLSSIFSEAAASRLQAHVPMTSCGAQKVPDFEPERTCFTLEG
jgi:class 3 adenylate cyclase